MFDTHFGKILSNDMFADRLNIKNIHIFTLFGTLIKTKSNNHTPMNCLDWEIIKPEIVLSKFDNILKNGGRILIFTNKSITPISLVINFCSIIHQPLMVFLFNSENEYSSDYKRYVENIPKSDTFFIGNLAGRDRKIRSTQNSAWNVYGPDEKDASSIDINFAKKQKLTNFFTPEEFFY